MTATGPHAGKGFTRTHAGLLAVFAVVAAFALLHRPHGQAGISGEAMAETTTAASLPHDVPRAAKKALRLARKSQGDAVLTRVDIEENANFQPDFLFYSPSAGTVEMITTDAKGDLAALPPQSSGNANTKPLPDDFIDLDEALAAARKQGLTGGIKEATLDVEDSGPLWTLQAAQVEDSGDPQRPPRYLFTVDAVTGKPPAASEPADSAAVQAASGPSGNNTMRWMTAPADAGKGQAAWEQGSRLYDQNQFGRALPVLTEAARDGNPRAMTVLGNMYHDGQGVPKDASRAFAWYKQAAELGNRGAQYDLGAAYEEGDGVAADEKQAAQWYTQSAHQGMPEAEFALGLSYEFGEGVKRDRRTAIYWLDQAGKQGDGRAHWIADWLSRPGTPQFKTEDQLGAYINGQVGGWTASQMARGNAAGPSYGGPAQEEYNRGDKAALMYSEGDHEAAARCASGGSC